MDSNAGDKFPKVEHLVKNFDNKSKLILILRELQEVSDERRSTIFVELLNIYKVKSGDILKSPYPVEFKVSLVLDNIDKPDSQVTIENGLGKTLISNWRTDILIILYFLVQKKHLKFIWPDYPNDSAIEETPLYQSVNKDYEDSKVLYKYLEDYEISAVIHEIPYLKEVIESYRLYGTLLFYLQEIGYLERQTTDTFEISDYNNMFRDFFFNPEANTGFFKFLRTITWFQKLKSNEYGPMLIKKINVLYNYKPDNQRDTALSHKYYSIKAVIEWIIREERKLIINNGVNAKYLEELFGTHSKTEPIDYHKFLEQSCKYPLLPKFLLTLMQIMASSTEGQFKIAKMFDKKITLKESVKQLGIFFSFLENALSDDSENITSTHVVSELRQGRNSLISDLKKKIDNYLLKEIVEQ